MAIEKSQNELEKIIKKYGNLQEEFQSKGIGTMIMNKLLEKIEEIKNENPNLRVYLGASKNKERFYKKFGFIERKNADLGEGMILKNN